MSNYPIFNPDAAIIPSNWVCNNCPHFNRPCDWSYRGACANAENNGTVAVFGDNYTRICKRAKVDGFITMPCEDDNRRHFRGDYGHANDGHYYSEDYCRGNFYYCENCGEWITDYNEYDSSLSMCIDCADEYYRQQNRMIGSWHEHKGTFEIVGDRKNPYTVGFEMEVEGSDEDHEQTARAIYDRFGDAFVFEYDCSLYDGFEIISQPHTIDAFNALNLEALETLLMNNGYEETDDASTTGLHIHLSTAFLGDTEHEKIRTLARLVRFYDRNYSALCELTDRKDTSHSYPNKDENYVSGLDYYDDYELVEAQVNGSRYVAVNCDRFYRGTFEIRLCDGTIRADKVRAWIDFNLALIECLRVHNSCEMFSVIPYLSDRAIDFYRRGIN